MRVNKHSRIYKQLNNVFDDKGRSRKEARNCKMSFRCTKQFRHYADKLAESLRVSKSDLFIHAVENCLLIPDPRLFVKVVQELQDLLNNTEPEEKFSEADCIKLQQSLNELKDILLFLSMRGDE